MFNFRRRAVIKAVTATAAATTLPTLDAAEISAQAGFVVVFEPCSPGARQRVRVSNAGAEQGGTLSVYPGQVAANGSVFDLNKVFASGDISLQPGESTIVEVSPLVSVEKDDHGGKAGAGQQVRVTTFNHTGEGVVPVHTTRELIA